MSDTLICIGMIIVLILRVVVEFIPRKGPSLDEMIGIDWLGQPLPPKKKEDTNV